MLFKYFVNNSRSKIILQNIISAFTSYLRFLLLFIPFLLLISCEYEELEPDFNGKLFVDSNPQMAEIYVDGTFTDCFTPNYISLSPGIYSIKLKHDSYLEADTTVKIESLQTTKLFMNLIRIDNLIDIELNPIQDNVKLYFTFKFNVDVTLNYIGVIHPTVNFGNYEEYHELLNDEFIFADSTYRVPVNSYFPGFSGTYTFLFIGKFNGYQFEKEKIYLKN